MRSRGDQAGLVFLPTGFFQLEVLAELSDQQGFVIFSGCLLEVFFFCLQKILSKKMQIFNPTFVGTFSSLMFSKSLFSRHLFSAFLTNKFLHFCRRCCLF